MMNAHTFWALLRQEQGVSPARFARWLAEENRESFQQLPGFLPAEAALAQDTETSEALRRMEELDVDVLAVVNEAGRFAGVVERSRLAAGLLLNVSRRLENQPLP